MQKIQIDAATWATLNRLLDEALEQPTAQLPQWLDDLAPQFDGLKPRLRELLSRTGLLETDEFLHTLPKFELEPGDLAAAPARAEQPGQEIGPYRLVRELGSGGMGVVWLAERTDGLINRPVALKLPHGAWKRAGLAERMAREREILATLTHPNIAHLYDAGLTADGQPYLAIEYVEGRRIDVYCREQQLALRARLRVVRAGRQCRRLCTRQAGRASRSEAGEHSGQRRRPGAPAGLRHRETAGRRPGEGDALHRDVRSRADSGLRLAGTDSRRAAHHRLGRLFAGRDSLRTAERPAPVQAAARLTRRAGRRHPAGRADRPQRGRGTAVAPCAARRSRHRGAQGIEEKAGGSLPDGPRLVGRHRALSRRPAGAGATGQPLVPRPEIHPPKPDCGRHFERRVAGGARRCRHRCVAGPGGGRGTEARRGGEGVRCQHFSRSQSVQRNRYHQPERSRPAQAGGEEARDAASPSSPGCASSC